MEPWTEIWETEKLCRDLEAMGFTAKQNRNPEPLSWYGIHGGGRREWVKAKTCLDAAVLIRKMWAGR